MSRRSRIFGTAAAASGVLTVTRTSSEPARASSATCFAVPATSAVSVLVIDCTTTGAPPPTTTLPMRTARVARLASITADMELQGAGSELGTCLVAAQVVEAGSRGRRVAARREAHVAAALVDHGDRRQQVRLRFVVVGITW